MTYADLEQLWYNIHRGKGLSHVQVAILSRDWTSERLLQLRAGYEGGEIKAERGVG